MDVNLTSSVRFLNLVLSVACIVVWCTELHTNGFNVKIIILILKAITATFTELGNIKK